MVRKEGQENGIGVWEVSGYSKLTSRIENAVEEGLDKQDHVDKTDISLEDILVVGSYGSGMGVPGKSDLDLIILLTYRGDTRSNDYSQCMQAIAGAVNYNESSILSGFSEFNGLETYVYPFLERQKHMSKMARHEPVENYYNLTEDKKKSYF